jgi:hypothetical protein
MKNTVYIFTAVSLSAFWFNQAPSLAQFEGVLHTIDRVNHTINSANQTINGVRGTVNNLQGTASNLSNFLGVRPQSNSSDPTQQVFDVYETWYKDLSASDKDIVSQFVMSYASNQMLSFEQIAQSDWFNQKNKQEQLQIGALFFKFNGVVEATRGQKIKFLAFAFCVNSGGQQCK